MQAGARGQIFGSQKNGVFSWDMGPSLISAAASKPDLLIYPFSPVEGALYRGPSPVFNKEVLVASETSVGAYFAALLPASTTLLTWNNLYTGGHFYNVFELWQSGRVVSQYDKRVLFPFMDYTPAWAARVGLFSTPFDEVAGSADNQLLLNGQPLGDLMCSELHNTALARSEARRAPIIIAVGSEAMFLDDVASEFSLKAAQLRAAENDIPVVRGNILGPSGIIDRFGQLQVTEEAGQAGFIESPVAITASRPTLYNVVGDWLVWLLTLGVLGGAWYWVPRKSRQ
jgi:apolipoprotein N-acyltransferase